MSNRDIRLLYQGICRGDKYTRQKRESDLYGDVLREAYKLTIVDDQSGEVIYTSEVSDDKLTAIQRDLERSQKIRLSNGKEMTVYELLDRCFEIDGWKKGNKNYDGQVLERAKSFINNVNINRDNFGLLLDLQTDPNNLIRTELLANPGTTYNYFDLLSSDVYTLFASSQDMYDFTNALWDTTTSIGNSNVGNGEIVMALFSDAVKGSRGDLYITGLGEIEVKGSGARMGSGKFAQMKTKNNLNKILKQREITVDIEVLNDIFNFVKNLNFFYKIYRSVYKINSSISNF